METRGYRSAGLWSHMRTCESKIRARIAEGAIAPLALYEWHVGPPSAWTATAIAGTVYLGVVITAMGYAVWNWCLERVGAARMAAFVNLQPLAGALLGVWWLREPLTPFLVAGGVLIVTGLHLTVNGTRKE